MGQGVVRFPNNYFKSVGEPDLPRREKLIWITRAGTRTLQCIAWAPKIIPQLMFGIQIKLMLQPFKLVKLNLTAGI